MVSSKLHEKYMKRCLELASKGLGNTGQNPLVGSVIVHNDRIIGEGYHREYGGPHAEVNAISAVKDPSLLTESTLYVNLEPCSHFGKTPPCTLLICDKNIPKVVIAMIDPNPEVSGSGIDSLKKAGIEVITGILSKEAEYLNRRFLVNQKYRRPYVILKWAESRDGFMDKIRTPEDPLRPNWITNHTARMLVHKWRSEENSITAGVNTLLTDNPSLNVRDWNGKSPIRVIIDRKNRIPENFHVKDDSIPTWIFSSEGTGISRERTEIINTSGDFSLDNFLQTLFLKGISSLLVEGGTQFINSFINNDLWDEARVFHGKERFLNGIHAPKINTIPQFFDIFRNNKLVIYVKSST